MTPGPIGINSATYCGYTAVMNATGDPTMGILGSITATIALILPSFILMLLISMLLLKYMETHIMKMIFGALRPAVVGLLAAAALMLCTTDNFGSPIETPWTFGVSLFIAIATFIGVKFVRVHPIAMLAHAAFAGLLLLY
jgi:chromate transporter